MDFKEANEQGKKAEYFFHKYSGHLVNGYCYYIQPEMIKENIGGMDILGQHTTRFEKRNPIPDGLPYERKVHYVAKSCGTSIIECKAINKFLFRDNDGNEPSGTISFELWSNAWGKNGRKPKNKWTNGWLYGYFHPEEHTKELQNSGHTDIQYITPDALAFIQYQNGKSEYPFAAIVFENFVNKVFKRLRQIAPWELYPNWKVE